MGLRTTPVSRIATALLLLSLGILIVPLDLGQGQSESVVSDPTGDIYDYNQLGVPAPAYVDLVQASVARIDGSSLELRIQVAGNIPSSLEETHYLAYLWQFDTDKNTDTRMYVVNDIGVDVGVRVFYDVRIKKDWIGDLGTIQQPSREIPRSGLAVSGNTIAVTISLTDLGNSSSFNWVASSIEYWIDRKDKPNYHDHAPDEGHALFDVVASSTAVTTAMTDTVATQNYPAMVALPVIAAIAILAALARRKPTGRGVGQVSGVQEVKRKMQIEVIDKDSGRVVRLEVESHHTVGSLMQTLVTGLGLPKGEYVLVLGEREFHTDDYSKTLEVIGIHDGAKLDLLRRQ